MEELLVILGGVVFFLCLWVVLLHAQVTRLTRAQLAMHDGVMKLASHIGEADAGLANRITQLEQRNAQV